MARVSAVVVGYLLAASFAMEAIARRRQGFRAWFDACPSAVPRAALVLLWPLTCALFLARPRA